MSKRLAYSADSAVPKEWATDVLDKSPSQPRRTTHKIPDDSFRVLTFSGRQEFTEGLHVQAREGFRMVSWNECGGDHGFMFVVVFAR